jgi:hypothetical protein
MPLPAAILCLPFLCAALKHARVIVPIERIGGQSKYQLGSFSAESITSLTTFIIN